MTFGASTSRTVRLLAFLVFPALLYTQVETPVKFSPIKVRGTRDSAGPSAWVITDDGQWKRFLSEILGHTGAPPRVDFRRHLVVAILAGQKPTAGYSIEVRKVTDDSRPGQPSRATVHYRLITPPPDAIVAQVLTYPSILVRVEKRFTSVGFDPPTPVATFPEVRR